MHSVVASIYVEGSGSLHPPSQLYYVAHREQVGEIIIKSRKRSQAQLARNNRQQHSVASNQIEVACVCYQVFAVADQCRKLCSSSIVHRHDSIEENFSLLRGGSCFVGYRSRFSHFAGLPQNMRRDTHTSTDRPRSWSARQVASGRRVKQAWCSRICPLVAL